MCYALDNIFVNSLKPLGQLKLFMWHHHGIGEKIESFFNNLGNVLLDIFVNPRGTGHLAGILSEILPRIAGLLAGL